MIYRNYYRHLVTGVCCLGFPFNSEELCKEFRRDKNYYKHIGIVKSKS